MGKGQGPPPPDDHVSPVVDAADVSRVRAVLALGGVPWGDLEDGVQQVRLKLLEEQARPRREPIRKPSAWVSVVASRVAVDWHRSRRRDESLRERLASRWLVNPPVDHSAQDRAFALTVADALDRLPIEQRRLLVLRFYLDLTVSDIAKVLEVPDGTIKSRLHAAVAALRQQLVEQEVSAR